MIFVSTNKGKIRVMAILIESERLILREFRIEDAVQLAEILGDPEVMKYIEPVYDLANTRDFVLKHGLCSPPRVFALVEKSSKRVIGHVIFHDLEDKDIYELGWILSKDCWGKGYAREVSEALLSYGFKEKDLHKIVAETIDPTRSLRLLRKLGMSLEGVQRKHVRRPNGEWADLYCCAILRDDWRDAKSALPWEPLYGSQ